MNGRLPRGCALGLVLGVLAVLAACSDAGGQQQCNCPPAGIGLATIELCGAIESAEVDPDGACNLQQSAGSLMVESDVVGTCRVEAKFATGATASTDIAFTSSWMACGSDPHGCGQGVVAMPTSVMLGPCGATEADAGGE